MRIVKGVIAGLVAAMASFVEPAAAKTCAELFVTGRATDATPVAILTSGIAKRLSRQDWVVDCKRIHAASWCVVGNAGGKRSSQRYGCSKSPNGLGGFNHDCTYRALPCKP